MRSSPAISVLLPVYNGEKYLRSCLDSVIAQSFGDFELLIGDDCSTDDTASVTKSISDSRIRCFPSTRNRGLFPNLNALIASARAPLVRFLCQDDILEPDCLAQEVAFFAAHPEVGMAFSKHKAIDAAGSIIGEGALNDLPTIIGPGLSRELLFYYGCIPANLSTVCARAQLVARCGGFDESFSVSGDYELWTRLCENTPLGVIHQRLVRLRHHDKQLSRKSSSGPLFISENSRITRRLLDALPGSVRSKAKRYLMLRGDVMAAHYAVRCVLAGRFDASRDILRSFGASRLLKGLACWLVTANNHVYRPRPTFLNTQ